MWAKNWFAYFLSKAFKWKNGYMSVKTAYFSIVWSAQWWQHTGAFFFTMDMLTLFFFLQRYSTIYPVEVFLHIWLKTAFEIMAFYSFVFFVFLFLESKEASFFFVLFRMRTSLSDPPIHTHTSCSNRKYPMAPRNQNPIYFYIIPPLFYRHHFHYMFYQ